MINNKTSAAPCVFQQFQQPSNSPVCPQSLEACSMFHVIKIDVYCIFLTVFSIIAGFEAGRSSASGSKMVWSCLRHHCLAQQWLQRLCYWGTGGSFSKVRKVRRAFFFVFVTLEKIKKCLLLFISCLNGEESGAWMILDTRCQQIFSLCDCCSQLVERFCPRRGVEGVLLGRQLVQA